MGDSHALIVGIAGYAHLPGLPEAVRNDARAVHELLIDPRHGGYPSGNAALLLDQAATREAVLDALAAIPARTSAAGSVVVYFSGHGGRVESGARAGEYLGCGTRWCPGWSGKGCASPSPAPPGTRGCRTW
jgi:hypothetical protein